MARKEEYHAPAKDTPKVGGAPAILAIIGVVATLGFTLALIVSGTVEWYVGVFLALGSLTLLSFLIWLNRLSTYRKEDVNAAYRAQFIADNNRWIENVVIPKIRRDASIELSFHDACELVYTGSVRIRLSKPYRNHLYDIYFKTDAKKNPIVTIRRLVDSYYTEGSPTELVANIPHQAKKRFLFKRRTKRPVATA